VVSGEYKSLLTIHYSLLPCFIVQSFVSPVFLDRAFSYSSPGATGIFVGGKGGLPPNSAMA
jgi:hypothetical protein